MYHVNQSDESMATLPTSVGINISCHGILWNTWPELLMASTHWEHTYEGEHESQQHALISVSGADTIPESMINGLRERIPIRT
jgi:hypothetical protein